LGVFEKIGSITLDDLKVVRSLFGLRAFAEYSIFFRTMAYKEVTIINYGGHKVVLTLNEYSKKVYSLLYLQNEKIIKDIKIVSDVKINKEAILKICDSIQILN
ncbi:MAG: hypothetical protein NE328_10560, partial [Lentisphaeraceae bacterium]|nr:hypothetical protein [Lentisphaeraceae bacterium]